MTYVLQIRWLQCSSWKNGMPHIHRHVPTKNYQPKIQQTRSIQLFLKWEAPQLFDLYNDHIWFFYTCDPQSFQQLHSEDSRRQLVAHSWTQRAHLVMKTSRQALLLERVNCSHLTPGEAMRWSKQINPSAAMKQWARVERRTTNQWIRQLHYASNKKSTVSCLRSSQFVLQQLHQSQKS